MVMGRGGALTPALMLSTIVSSVLAAWIGWRVGLSLSADLRRLFMAAALLVAGAQVWLLRAGPAPREPTRSFVAILLVLVAAMATDAARILILAIALLSGDFWPVVLGGALGSGAASIVARRSGRLWEGRMPAGLFRNLVAVLFIICGIAMGLAALGESG